MPLGRLTPDRQTQSTKFNFFNEVIFDCRLFDWFDFTPWQQQHVQSDHSDLCHFHAVWNLLVDSYHNYGGRQKCQQAVERWRCYRPHKYWAPKNKKNMPWLYYNKKYKWKQLQVHNLIAAMGSYVCPVHSGHIWPLSCLHCSHCYFKQCKCVNIIKQMCENHIKKQHHIS